MRRYLSAACAALLLVLVPVASASAVTAKVAVGNSSAGSILIDGHGKSLYRFGRDTGRKSTCNGACAQNWPPLLTTKTPKAGSGVSARKLGTTRRSDGKLQVTYAGHPLYNFVGDATRGDINGEGLNAFGGIWTLVAPSGAKIAPGASQSSPTPNPTPSPSPAPSPSPGFPY
jgi:predicted lipoprotein with Yx(FWY)xxD motif